MIFKKSPFNAFKKQSYYFNSAFAILLSVTFFFSCEKNVEEDSDILDDTSCDPEISYVLNVRPIIDNNCLECHAGSQPPNLSTFEGLSSNAVNVRTQVVTRQMPQGGSLTEEEIEFIRCWIDNGILNN